MRTWIPIISINISDWIVGICHDYRNIISIIFSVEFSVLNCRSFSRIQVYNFYYFPCLIQGSDDGDNTVNNPDIYNVEGVNMLSPGHQQVAVRSTTPDNRYCVENLFLILFCNYIFYAGNYFVVFCKTKHLSTRNLRAKNSHPRVDNFRCSPHVRAMIVYYFQCSIQGFYL